VVLPPKKWAAVAGAEAPKPAVATPAIPATSVAAVPAVLVPAPPVTMPPVEPRRRDGADGRPRGAADRDEARAEDEAVGGTAGNDDAEGAWITYVRRQPKIVSCGYSALTALLGPARVADSKQRKPRRREPWAGSQAPQGAARSGSGSWRDRSGGDRDLPRVTFTGGDDGGDDDGGRPDQAPAPVAVTGPLVDNAAQLGVTFGDVALVDGGAAPEAVAGDAA
jgi:hypothetical protein